jgi:hypothetical protein
VQHRVLDVALRLHCNSRRCRRTAVVQQLVSFVARRAEDDFRIRPGAFQDIVGRVPDEIAGRSDRAIALLAFVMQALVSLLALRGELGGIDRASTLARPR